MSNPEEFKPVPFYFINTTRKKELSPAEAGKAMKRLKDARIRGMHLLQ